MSKRVTRGSGSSKRSSKQKEREEVVVPQIPQEPQVPLTPHVCPLWNDKEKEQYDALGRVKFVPTRFLSKDFLTALGMREEVEEFVGRMGLGKLAGEYYHSYPELTRQFLATLDVIHEHPRRKKVSECRINFKIYNNHYALPIERVCGAYGFNNGPKTSFPGFQETWFWNFIGGKEPFSKGASKASLIRNPVAFMAHRFLANTIFPRMDQGKVKHDELCLLFQGLKHILCDYFAGGRFSDYLNDDANLGYIFATELKKHQQWCLTSPLFQPISSIGGVLVPLFMEANVPLHLHKPDPVMDTLDLEAFTLAKTIKASPTARGQFIYYFRDVEKRACTFLLPNRDLTSPTTLDNIRFHYGNVGDAQEEAPQEEQPPPIHQEQAPPTHQGPPPQTASLEELFQYMHLQRFPYEPTNDHERWFVAQHELQDRFNGMMMQRLGEYDALTGRTTRANASPSISGFSEYQDFEEDPTNPAGPSSSHP